MRKTKKKEPTRAEKRAARRMAKARQERKNATRRAKREAARKQARAPKAPPDLPSENDVVEVYVDISEPRIEKIDENIARYLRAQVEEAVGRAAERNGVRIEVSKAEVDREYGDAMKVTVVVRVPQFNARGEEVPYRETAWMRYAHTLGLKTDWLGRKVVIGNVTYRIAGLDLKHKQKPVLLSLDGKLFRESADGVVKLVRG